jgi:BirA family transcriptional regulator, biotin operon repressor / biotin---[acetyl-CoA-carboxylase] ligase
MPKFRVHRLKSVDSTNSEAQRLYGSGEREPVWVVADEQISGRGRLGRRWFSTPGNLYSTLLLPTKATARVAAQLGFVTALSVANAVNSLAKEQITQLKWPNDCLIDGAKFCGILSEVLVNQGTAIAIGCGINIDHSPRNVAYPVTHLSAHFRVKIDEAFEAYTTELEKFVDQWNHGQGFSIIAELWKAHAIGVGHEIEVRMGDVLRSGTFVGVAPDGALIMDVDCKPVHIYAGEIRIPALEKQHSSKA